MTYLAYEYDFNRKSIHNILERRVESWVKQVEIASKAGVRGAAMDSLLCMLALDLNNYRRSPLGEWNDSLLQKANDLLDHADSV